MADDELDDVGQTTPKGTGAAWQWRAIAQIMPALLLSGIREREKQPTRGESREPQQSGWQSLLGGVLDRLTNALVRLEAKINAGPVVSEQQAAQKLGLSPEAVREYAPYMGIPFEQSKSGEVSFRENHLKLAYVPPEAGSSAATAAMSSSAGSQMPLSGVPLSGLAEPPQSLPVSGSPPTGKDAALPASGAPPWQGMSDAADQLVAPTTPQKVEIVHVPDGRPNSPGAAASLDVARTSLALPGTDPAIPASSGQSAALPPDNTVGMAVRGVDRRDTVIERLSAAARDAFSGGQTAASTEQLSPGEAASVPAGTKVVVEVQNREFAKGGQAADPGERRTFSRRVVDRLLPVSQEEREASRGRGADASVEPSRSLQIRRGIRSLAVRGKRSLRSASRQMQKLGKSSFGRTKFGRAVSGIGSRAAATAAQGLGTVGRAAAVTGTGAAASSATSGVTTAAATGGAATAGLATGAIAVVGFTAAIAGAASLLKSFAQNLTESNRRLGMYNGVIAAANARLDVRRIQNDIQFASGTQASASSLADAVADMETSLLPLRQDFANLMNTAATYGARTVELLGNIYEKVSLDATERAEILLRILDAIPGVDMSEVIAELKEMKEQQRKQQQGAKPFGQQFAEALRNNQQNKQQAGVQARPPINPQWEQRGF